MQNAKDTFYVTLRDRLAVLNASRTVIERGVTRPGIVVEENELPSAGRLVDVFVLRWTEFSIDLSGRYALRCEIGYATEGGADAGGVDRGRALSAMDAELVAMLAPAVAVKTEFSGSAAVAMATRIFWGEAVFAAVKESGNALLQRVVTVDVYGYEEVGER